ncbi:MAG: serine/threonine-protein kinase [Planctomycetaceae bacterium]
MSARYPVSADGHAVIHRSDTDAALSFDAQMVNNTRYLYFKKIALGGKCLIQSCRDLHLGRVICYKTLRPEFADDPHEQTMFLREARVTAMLQHPNTAPVYEVGFDNKRHYYFTMKLVSGATLREVLDLLKDGDPKTTAAWDLERLIDVIIQVGQVLYYAHTHGVVHCDVKPENIVVGDYGEVLLLDWGLALVKDREDVSRSDDQNQDDRNVLSSRTAHQGTPLYMSPEQFSGADIDHRTDIYSMGAILFEVLTLQQLAWGEDMDEIQHNMNSNPPPTPSMIAPNRAIPRALETLYLRCVQRDPGHRIQTSLEFIHELLYWLRVDKHHRPV